MSSLLLHAQLPAQPPRVVSQQTTRMHKVPVVEKLPMPTPCLPVMEEFHSGYRGGVVNAILVGIEFVSMRKVTHVFTLWHSGI